MIALDPTLLRAMPGRDWMYAGQPAEALESIAIAMRLDPHYPAIVLHFLAQANFSLGRYETAIPLLIDRVARNPVTDASRC
jgi:adenylate cyclase